MSGGKCPQCSKTKGLTEAKFIERATRVHNGFFSYKNCNFSKVDNLVTVTCPIHGSWNPKANNHLRGANCPCCSKEGITHPISIEWEENGKTKKLNTNSFIEKARKIHGDKYQYEKVEYTRTHNNIVITCPTHGNFKMDAANHLRGQGCPRCNQSHLEQEIYIMLINNNINFEQNKKYEWLKNDKNKLSLDFYLPEFNIAIECQGIQHFKSIKYFGGQKQYQKQVENDICKLQKCEEHGIKLLYYSNLGLEYPYKVFEDKNLLLEAIKQ